MIGPKVEMPKLVYLSRLGGGACDLEGKLMLVSTHNLGSVPDFCDEVVLLNRRVLAAGPTADVFTQKNLELAFGGALPSLATR